MSKGAVIVGVGAGLALLAVAAFAGASTDAPSGPRRVPSSQRRGSRRPTEEEEEEYGTRWSAECNEWDTTIQVLEGQRDSVKGGLVDIDAALMAAYANGDDEQAAQLELARKGQQQVLSNINAQIAGLDAKIDAECVNSEDRA